MPIHDFWLFVVASLALNITPGNDMIYVITRSTSQGVRAGVVSAFGIMGGCLVHILAAVVGLSALIAGSALAFDLIKYAGAAYLFYLGIRALLSKKNTIRIDQTLEKKGYRQLFWQGVVTNTLNPKVALFFLAFLPQFIDVHSKGTTGAILFLGIWFNVSGTFINILVAWLFGTIGQWLHRSRRFIQWQQRVTGLLLVALGIKVAISSRK